MDRESIHESLTKKLESKSANLAHFADLVNDYMNFWDVKNALNDDLKARGVMYTDKSSVGVDMQKNNPSTKELVMVNRQMLSILKELGFNTSDIGANDGDDEM